MFPTVEDIIQIIERKKEGLFEALEDADFLGQMKMLADPNIRGLIENKTDLIEVFSRTVYSNRVLLKHESIRALITDQKTLIELFKYIGSEVAQLLLLEDSNIRALITDKETLIEVLQQTRHVEKAQLLILKNPNIRGLITDKKTLIEVLKNINTEELQLLLLEDSNIRALITDKETLIEVLQQTRHFEKTQLLLLEDPNINIRGLITDKTDLIEFCKGIIGNLLRDFLSANNNQFLSIIRENATHFDYANVLLKFHFYNLSSEIEISADIEKIGGLNILLFLNNNNNNLIDLPSKNRSLFIYLLSKIDGIDDQEYLLHFIQESKIKLNDDEIAYLAENRGALKSKSIAFLNDWFENNPSLKKAFYKVFIYNDWNAFELTAEQKEKLKESFEKHLKQEGIFFSPNHQDLIGKLIGEDSLFEGDFMISMINLNTIVKKYSSNEKPEVSDKNEKTKVEEAYQIFLENKENQAKKDFVVAFIKENMPSECMEQLDKNGERQLTQEGEILADKINQKLNLSNSEIAAQFTYLLAHHPAQVANIFLGHDDGCASNTIVRIQSTYMKLSIKNLYVKFSEEVLSSIFDQINHQYPTDILGSVDDRMKVEVFGNTKIHIEALLENWILMAQNNTAGEFDTIENITSLCGEMFPFQEDKKNDFSMYIGEFFYPENKDYTFDREKFKFFLQDKIVMDLGLNEFLKTGVYEDFQKSWEEYLKNKEKSQFPVPPSSSVRRNSISIVSVQETSTKENNNLKP